MAARVLQEVKLVPMDPCLEAGATAVVGADPVTLGRRALSSPPDMRCSRQQLMLRATSGGATLTGLGSNPSYVRRAAQEIGADSEFVIVNQPSLALCDGDIVFLVGKDYPLRVDFVYSAAEPAAPERSVSPSVRPQEPPASAAARRSPPLEQGAREQRSTDVSPADAIDEESFASGFGALRQYAAHPERFAGVLVGRDDTAGIVVVRDRFPKAKIHLLAVCGRLERPAALTPSEAPTIERMSAMLRECYETLGGTALGDPRIGLHAAPSMAPLHVHCLSPDLCSARVKTKKHWNSFASEFFVPASSVVRALRAGKSGARLIFGDRGRCEALLKAPMRCHRCGAQCATVPAMLRHAESCGAQPPSVS